ncbi:MAG: hypothetical protein ACD_20C00143G0002 [uncultured bacterium]|nr:MAG: hypothetical protein ACD_20C00143G0002 [uncultured bacterium]
MFPIKFAVIVLAVKFPAADRFTIVLKVFSLVEAFARFAPAEIPVAFNPPTVITVRLP